jgi:microcystin-dependent protein
MTIAGTGIPAGARVVSFTSTSIVISIAATATTTGIALSGTLRTNNRLGGFGGVENVSLQIAELASHLHIQDPHNHNHISNATGYASGANGGNVSCTPAGGQYVGQLSTATNQTTGSGTAHPNMQPYLVQNFVVVAQ